jgi:hypothetical protein
LRTGAAVLYRLGSITIEGEEYLWSAKIKQTTPSWYAFKTHAKNQTILTETAEELEWHKRIGLLTYQIILSIKQHVTNEVLSTTEI